VHRLLLVAAVVLLAAGCGGDDASEPVEQASVYFLLDGQVWPTARDVEEGDAAAESVVAELAAGPTADEVAEMGLAGGFPEGVEVSVAGEVATVESDAELSAEQRAQLVYSLIQPAVGVTSVEIDGESLTRADFEEQTPSVLVESPLPFEEVSAPITATGTANTFEANFLYELLDADGNVIDENFVTATSGTGTRGTFEFTTAAVEGVAALVVFEESAEDGSRMREVRIPLSQAS
jgi:hypothetical protein